MFAATNVWVSIRNTYHLVEDALAYITRDSQSCVTGYEDSRLRDSYLTFVGFVVF